MKARSGVVVVLAWLVCNVACAQDIERGTLKSLNVAQQKMVVTVGDADIEFQLSDRLNVLDAADGTLAERLQAFRAGDAIQFQRTAVGSRELRAVRRGGQPPASRPGNVQSGIVRAVDAERRTVTLAVGDAERQVTWTDRTDVQGLNGATVTDRIGKLTVGMTIQFLARTVDGRDVLVGIRTGQSDAPGNRRDPGVPVSPDVSGLIPLTELGTGLYGGFAGGLYPDGHNVRPDAHEAAGLAIARAVKPLNAAGQPDEDGRIVLLSIGMSNTSQSSQGFQAWLRNDDQVNSHLVFVNGAQGGMTAAAIQNPDDGGRGTTYWSVIDERLAESNVTRQQVQAVWIKQADAGPRTGFPAYARTLEMELARIVQVIAERFPNCRLAYLSSRTFGGYATTTLNPEPYAYESGFSVKWLIKRQIGGDMELNFDPDRGAVKSPWLSWGAYLWARGETARRDGFSYIRDDFAGDGTHQSSSGQRKVGRLMLDFFHDDSTTKPWFDRQ